MLARVPDDIFGACWIEENNFDLRPIVFGNGFERRVVSPLPMYSKPAIVIIFSDFALATAL